MKYKLKKPIDFDFLLSQLDACAQLGRFWNSNPARQPNESDKETKIQAFVFFLIKLASNPLGSNHFTDFQGDQSAWSCCNAPWRGFFPRNPLCSIVKFNVVVANDLRRLHQSATVHIPIADDNPETSFCSSDQVQTNQEHGLGEEEIQDTRGLSIEIENSFTTTELESMKSPFQVPYHDLVNGNPSAPALGEIQEGQSKFSAATQEIYQI